ncbi:MAG: cyclic beta 1-2 glucan synthetase, partial [Coriobacteriia bacterium]|nr:cyclic beta 1-2 glucan synthetase [Coriobacteriia bacterium]
MDPTIEAAQSAVPGSDEPLRGELLGAERLAAAARRLARAQVWAQPTDRARTPLLRLIDEVERDLTGVYRILATDVRDDIPVAPAAEWLLDNFYLVEEQIRLVRDDLPLDYGAELPRLTTGPFTAFPRVFEAAVVLTMHTDSRIDREGLELYTMAYQDVSPLLIGEVWAMPIMLRITLVENLRRLAHRILEAHQAVVGGNRFADSLIVAADSGSEAIAERIAELDRAHAEAPAPFLVRLSQRLSGQDQALAPLADWLESTLAQREENLEQLTLVTHQRQAADQVSIANAITSIRFLDGLEWREYFEYESVVEHI